MSFVRRVTSVLAFAAALAPAADLATAQAEAGKPRMWWVHEERARPNMLAQYEATSKEFVKMVMDNRKAMPHFSFVGFQGDDFVYTYLAPIETMAGGDALAADFAALAQADGKRMADVMGRGGAAMESIADWIVEEHPELSYVPAQPRLKREEMTYAHVDFYHIIPGREMEVDTLSKEFQALWKAKGVQNGWTLYKAVTGNDLPMIVVRTDAKSAADYYANEIKDRALVGAEGAALFNKAFNFTRRYESRGGTIRPDLSIAPMTAGATTKK